MTRDEVKELGRKVIAQVRAIAEANINETAKIKSLPLDRVPGASFGNDGESERFWRQLCDLAASAKKFRSYEQPHSGEQGELRNLCAQAEQQLTKSA